MKWHSIPVILTRQQLKDYSEINPFFFLWMMTTMTYSSMQGAIPKRSKGRAVTILIGILIVIIIAVALAFYFTSGVTNVARQELNAIQAGDIDKAYAMTSKAFQAATPLDAFKMYVDKYTVLKNYKNISFTNRKVEGNSTGYAAGTIEATDGTKMAIEFQFVKEENQWKIQGMRLSDAGLLPSLAATEETGKPSIHAVLISDKADKDGYVETENTTIATDAPKIYATVQAIVPESGIGTKVTALLTHIPSGATLGPVTGDITKAGNVMKAITFTRNEKTNWPVGDYKVSINLSTGDSKEVTFTVK